MSHENKAHETDHMFVMDSENVISSDAECAVFPPPPLKLRPGEGSEYLSTYLFTYTKVQGSDVTLDRRRNTTEVKIFAGLRAKTTELYEALLDTGSPESFYSTKAG